jgi:putative Holliday junction resolvase
VKSRVLAIDFGLKRTGLAISDATKTIALPWTTVHGNIQAILSKIKTREAEIETIVVGLPLLMNGEKGEMALKAEAFANEIKRAFPDIAVKLYDERLSSRGAEAMLKMTGQSRKQRSQKTDETAATLLLQSYL